MSLIAGAYWHQHWFLLPPTKICYLKLHTCATTGNKYVFALVQVQVSVDSALISCRHLSLLVIEVEFSMGI